MSAGVAMRHTLRAYFYSSTTLGVTVYLYSLQIEVCPLCVGVVLGTTIDIVICCISRLLFLPYTTLDMPSLHSLQTRVCLLPVETLGSLDIVVRLCSPQTGVYLLRAEVPIWLHHFILSFVASQESSLRPTRLSVLPYDFTTLRP